MTTETVYGYIDLTEISLNSKTAVELRKLGAQCGIQGASKGRKADLLESLMQIKEAQISRKEREAAEAAAKQAAADTPVVVRTGSKRKGHQIPAKCEICGTRPRMQPARMEQVHGVKFPYCEPCLIKADWENTHSDEGHADIVSLGTNDLNRAGCWVCHPELDKSSADYKPRPGAGISRKGQVIHAKGDKISVVRTAAEVAGYHVTVGDITEGQRVLKATTHTDELVLAWDDHGRYIYIASSWNGRRVRNVAEALRLIAT